MTALKRWGGTELASMRAESVSGAWRSFSSDSGQSVTPAMHQCCVV
jgi:hypothetical protein